MPRSIQSLRGMRDLLPGDSWRRALIEAKARKIFTAFGYSEIRLPILESTDLFSRCVGEATDLVEKEMYTLTDRDGDSITLRPEGTAGTVRACLQHGLIFNQIQRLWYAGPMFRYERPQQGRYRQFEQIGAEAFGIAGSELDAELIQLCQLLFEELEIASAITLQINTIGTPTARKKFSQALVSYLTDHVGDLDPDSQRRLQTNPLRILDSKNSRTQCILDQAPNLLDFVESEAMQRFELLQSILQSLNIACEVNPRLVRGLDYYTYTVFEFVTDALGAQGTVCGGGRYDGLVEQLGGRPTPGAGFAMGVDRLCLLHEKVHEKVAEQVGVTRLDVYCLVDRESGFGTMMALAQTLRQANPGLRIGLTRASGKFKNQIKRAQQSGAACLMTLDPVADQGQETYTLRWLQVDRAEDHLTHGGLMACLSELNTRPQH